MSGFISQSGAGVSSQTRFSTAAVISARKGTQPAHSVYSTLPKLNRSVR
jgi:hypothetical protein